MSRKPASATGEDRIVELLLERFAGRNSLLKKGIGDDGAVLRLPGAKEDWVVTSDMLLEEVDFRRDWQTPGQLGWKALAVNLSDLAAMGARPRFYTVSLGLPRGIGEQWIRGFYKGLTVLGNSHGAVLIGGDLSGSPSGIQISITALGETLRRRAVYRSGGSAADWIYVSGVLGRSASGLSLLLGGCRRAGTKAERSALEAHRRPLPRCAEGLWLAQSGYAGALMDLSDGLSVDLARLCRASGTGAEIHVSRLPLFRGSVAWGCDPAELALHGAEDFELVFTIRRAQARRFEESYPSHLAPVTRIGHLTRGAGVRFSEQPGSPSQPLTARGFDHFRD